MHPAWRRCSSLAELPVCALIAPCQAGASTPNSGTRLPPRVLTGCRVEAGPACESLAGGQWRPVAQCIRMPETDGRAPLVWHLRHRVPAQLLQHVRAARHRRARPRCAASNRCPRTRDGGRGLPEGPQLHRTGLLAGPPAVSVSQARAVRRVPPHRLGRGDRRDRDATGRHARAAGPAERAVLLRQRDEGTAQRRLDAASGGCSGAARPPTATCAGPPASRPRG